MGRYSGRSCRLILMLVATSMFFVTELVAGYVGNSIALVSDAFNMLSDVISLSVGLLASRVRKRTISRRCTYGLLRVEVLGAWANAMFLFAIRLSMTTQALVRLVKPESIDNPSLVLVIGAMGLGVNLMGLIIFQDWRCLCRRRMTQEHQDPEPNGDVETEAGIQKELQEVEEIEDEGEHLNIRGVLLHMLNDALGSVVVVVSASLFYIWPLSADDTCNWQCYVDPGLTLMMVVIIMPSAIPLVREAANILLQIIPRGLPFHKTLEEVCRLPGVLSIHDAHMWELTKGRYVSSLHVKVSTQLHKSVSGIETLHKQIRNLFHSIGIHSVTVQLEFSDGSPGKNHCSTPCETPVCMKLSCCPPDIVGLPVCKKNEELVEEKGDVMLKEHEAKWSANTDCTATKF